MLLMRKPMVRHTTNLFIEKSMANYAMTYMNATSVAEALHIPLDEAKLFLECYETHIKIAMEQAAWQTVRNCFDHPKIPSWDDLSVHEDKSGYM